MKTIMETTFDFGSGPVAAARHTNPDGSQGGWVSVTATVEATVFVGPEARIFGNAQVYENAHVFGNTWVSGTARVCGDARVSGYAWVSEDAQVYGNAQVSGYAWVYGNAQVCGDAVVSGNACVSEDAIVSSRNSIAHGFLAGYNWTCMRGWIQFGCESHELAWWQEQDLIALCKKHGHDADFVGILEEIFRIEALLQ